MPDDRFKTTELPVVETEVATELPVIETEVVTETPVVETEKVAAQYPVVPLRTDGLDPNFNYKDFYENGRIDFSPEYFEDIMKLFEGRKKITSEASGRSYTPLQALATQAAEEFNGQTGMGSYKEFKEGKSKFRPGVKFTDQMILERLTTMEEKGFLESLGTRLVENVPGSTAFGTAFAATKRFTSWIPDGGLKRPIRTGYRPVDMLGVPLQTAYIGTKTALPYIAGFASSIFANPYGEGFGEFFLGKKTLPTPDSYSTMRRGEVVADFAAFTPYAFVADKAASNTIIDYFANRLAFSVIPTKQGPVEAFGRGFDFSGSGPSGTFAKQWKNAVEIAKNKRSTPSAKTKLSEEGASSKILGEFRGTRGGRQFEGPLNINDLNERGVAAVLQGKTAPATLRVLLVMEQALKTAGIESRKNPKLTLFYEALAAGGASTLVAESAKNNPFGTSETVSELVGGIGAPLAFGQLTIGVGQKIAPYLKNIRANMKDLGPARGFLYTVKEGFEEAKNMKAFSSVLKELEAIGSLDSPEQIEGLIARLAGAKSGETAGRASRDPAIMAMEAGLMRENESLTLAQAAAKKKEIDFLSSVLERLSFGEGTEFDKDAVRISAQIKEMLFAEGLNKRLSTAENNLLKAYSQVEKSKATGLGPDGSPLTTEELEQLNSEDMMDLSNRLVQMLTVQKSFARAQQKSLYDKVGNFEVNAFFSDDGEFIGTPKFIRLLTAEGIIDESSVKGELRSLFRFSQRQSDALGLNLDIDRMKPKLDRYNEARKKLTGAGSLTFFDTFTSKLSTSVDNDGLPNVVTDAMIDEVRQGRNRRKGEKIKDTFDLYDNYMDALIEKKFLQGPEVTAGAENVARQTQIDNFDAQAASFAENINDAETVAFNDFLLNIEDFNPSEKAVAIRNFVSANALRPTAHPGLPIAAKLDFISENPSVDLEEARSAVGISLQDLRQIRSEALGLARDGAIKPESRRIAGMFASAIEDDLNNFANFGADNVPIEQIKALRNANSFTKAFADVYYRSYVGDALAQTREGGFRLAPETLAETFGKNRFDPNYLKIRDIEKVGQFAREQGIPGAEGAVDSLHGVMDRILRSARTAALDPETGNVSKIQLAKWIKSNSRLEEMFPEMFEDLKNFGVARALFDQTTMQTSASQAFINKQINFTSLLTDSKGQIRANPASAIAEAMAGGKDQLRALSRLIDVIPKGKEVSKKVIFEITDPDSGLVSKFFTKKEAFEALQTMGPQAKMSQQSLSVTREEAVAGFKASMFEYLVFGAPSGRGANKNAAIDDPLRLYRDLFEKKLIAGGPTGSRRGDKFRYSTLTEFLKKKGVFSDADINGLDKTLKALIVAKSDEAASMLGDNFEEAKPLLDFALAISGSAIGTKSQSFLMGGSGGPGSIIAAGKGAEAMRNIFLRMPQSQRMLFTAELMQNPQLMAKMLRKYGDDDQAKGVVETIKNWLKANSFVTIPRRAFSVGDSGEARESEEGEFTPETLELPLNDQQGAVVPTQLPSNNQQASLNSIGPLSAALSQQGSLSPVQRPSPVGPPTTQASAVPSSPPPPVNSGPVDRTRYAALFPNDTISSMLTPTRQMARGGIASLMR